MARALVSSAAKAAERSEGFDDMATIIIAAGRCRVGKQRSSVRPMMPRRVYALVGLILVMLVWGSTYVVTKIAVRDIPPLTLAVLRYLIAAVVLVPVAIARGGLMRLPRPLPIGSLISMGLTGVAILTVGFNYGLLYGSASQGALIYALSPAAVAIAAVFGLGESLSRRRIAGIALSVAGTALVVASGRMDPGAPRPLLGALCMAAGIIAWAGYTVVAKRLAGADQIVVIAWVSIIGTVLLLPFAAIELLQAPMIRLTLEGWLSALFLGAVASAGAYVVYSLVLRELDASLVGAWFPLDPLVGVATAVLFLGEELHRGQVVGGVIALGGMWLAASSPLFYRSNRRR
jgi:drug/metabolite transporter (DMT)-like permease